MDAFSIAALRTELQQDPAGLGYAATLAEGAIGSVVGAINLRRAEWTARKPLIPVWELAKWAAQGGRHEKLEGAVASAPAGIKSVAAVALRMIDAPLMPGATFDVDEPAVAALVDVLITATVLASDDKAALLALGSQTPASRAEVLWGYGVVVTDIQVQQAGGQ